MVRQIINITGEEQWTEWVELPHLSQLFLGGIAGSTVTFQGSPDAGVTTYDLQAFTAETFKTITLAHTEWVFRAGVKTGDYGSDNIQLRLEA